MGKKSVNNDQSTTFYPRLSEYKYSVLCTRLLWSVLIQRGTEHGGNEERILIDRYYWLGIRIYEKNRTSLVLGSDKQKGRSL